MKLTTERKLLQFDSIILDLIDEFVVRFYNLQEDDCPRDYYDVQFTIDHKYYPAVVDLQQ